MIVHKNNVPQTDDQQFLRELFQNCLHNSNQKRNTTGSQTFDAGSLLLSLQSATKKIRKALKIIKSSFYLPKNFLLFT